MNKYFCFRPYWNLLFSCLTADGKGAHNCFWLSNQYIRLVFHKKKNTNTVNFLQPWHRLFRFPEIIKRKTLPASISRSAHCTLHLNHFAFFLPKRIPSSLCLPSLAINVSDSFVKIAIPYLSDGAACIFHISRCLPGRWHLSTLCVVINVTSLCNTLIVPIHTQYMGTTKRASHLSRISREAQWARITQQRERR